MAASEALASSNTDSLDLKQLLRTLTAVKKGDFSVRMPVEQARGLVHEEA